MSAIFFILIGAGIAYALMNVQQRRYETLDVDAHSNPVNAFLHYKKRIIATSAYTDESTYILLYEKIKTLTCEFIEKHSSVLVARDVLVEIDENFGTYFELERDKFRIKRTLNINEVSNEVLLALSIISFCGKKWLDGAAIEVNQFFCNRAIEYLIEERHFWPADLAKALILKYGFEPYLAPRADICVSLLRGLTGGYHPAYDELKDMDMYRQLENIKSVHPGKGRHGDWESHELIERRLKLYHPMNMNG